jgi:hypothetical protein
MRRTLFAFPGSNKDGRLLFRGTCKGGELSTGDGEGSARTESIE